MDSITADVTPPVVPPPQPPSRLDANPPSNMMPEASSSISSVIGKKMALMSISSPSINPAPDRHHQQISEDTEMAVDQSSSPPPRKVVKRFTGITIKYWWYAVCDCGMYYRIENIKSQIYRISSRETIVEVPYVKEYVHFDCPCGSRVELTINLRERKPVKNTKHKVVYDPMARGERRIYKGFTRLHNVFMSQWPLEARK